MKLEHVVSFKTFMWKNRAINEFFWSKSKVGICNRVRFLLLPFVALTSQEAFNFEKLCWKKTIQNVSSISLFELSISSRSVVETT